MATHKHIGLICALAAVLAIVFTVVLMLAARVTPADEGVAMGYEDLVFDDSVVHTIDIQMSDWDSFIATCENEEYSACAVTVDGETFEVAGIRAKGNTSLSNVSAMGSDRYSFKIEFDHYDSGSTYHGLDKLSLNNLIQDATYMKDYLTYKAMAAFDVDAPLCSYVYLTVNGEDWGLYLAVEGVEDSYLERNHGSDYGELYKPDSMSFGGGRGNGAGFDMSDFAESGEPSEDGSQGVPSMPGGGMPEGFDPSNMPEGAMPEGFDPSGFMGSGMLSTGEGTDGDADSGEEADGSTDGNASGSGGGFDFGGMFSFGGMGSSDVKLQYIDDRASSYSNIFDNAKTNVADADKARLIDSLEQLSARENIESIVNVDQVLRYFVVHNFVVNGDSYTGSMVHNYYLYEEGGRLSMIPWDYNLAFGTFSGGDATSAVNDAIDTPLSAGGGDRPMFDWIVGDKAYLELYHEYFAAFLEEVDLAAMAEETAALIAPYVEKDPTAFYSYEEFVRGAAAIVSFCELRAESVAGQLDGTIPSTDDDQAQGSSALVDAGELVLSDMGSMGDIGMDEMGSGMPAGGFGPPRGDFGMPDAQQPKGGSAPESPSVESGATRGGALRGPTLSPDNP